MTENNPQRRSFVALETGLLALVMGGLVWVAAPDVNEAHYLVKARHFWDRSFCPTDIFTNSHETHWAFYITHGWLFPLLGYELGTWIGRLASWLVIAWGIVVLSRVFWNGMGIAILVGGLTVMLNESLNLAGEWFVGGVEGKCYAYGFGFAAIAFWFRGRFPLTWILLGLACAFHIVVGIWLTSAMVFAWWVDRWLPAPPDTEECSPVSSRPFLRWFPAACLGLLFFTVGFWPAIMQNADASREVIVQAAKAQSLWRLAHHQLATEFHRWFLFLPLVVIWLFLARSNWQSRNHHLTRFNLVVLGSLLIALGGLVLSLLASFSNGPASDLSALLLTLYWFRLADVLIPLGCVINAGIFFSALPKEMGAGRFAVALATVGCLGGMAWNLYQGQWDVRSGSARQTVMLPQDPAKQQREMEAEKNWIRTCLWIRANTSPDAIFITPLNQQTFKWYAHRAEVASRKDMPQNATSILPWLKRLNVLFSIGPEIENSMELSMQDQVAWEYRPLLFDGELPFSADYVVLEQRWVDEFLRYQPLPENLKQVYPERGERKSTFAVFQQSDFGD